MNYYTKTSEELFAEFGTSLQGLSNNSVAKQRKRYGSNEITVKTEPLWRKLIEPFKDIFMAVLLVAVVISIWHQAYFDAFVVLGIMAASAIIYYAQRFSTERILRSLEKKSLVRVSVMRNSELHTLSATELVPGDIILLSEGEKVPADARILVCKAFRVDESQLTGESLPIDKTAGVLHQKKQVYEQSNMVFQGSFVIGGEATLVVVATGDRTEFGRIAGLSMDVNTASPVQEKIDALIKRLVVLVAALALVAFLLALVRGIELAEALRFVIALSVSAVPEGLPVAIAVILAIGMKRMASKKALVRSMRAIESIGVVTTIATDKTGTLTKNILSVQDTWQLPHTNDVIAEVMLHASNTHAGKVHDPLDIALASYAGNKHAHPFKQLPVMSYPFDQALALSGNAWHHADEYQIYIKGAPEKILARCHLSSSDSERAHLTLHEMTSKGYRVIALARKSAKTLPGTLNLHEVTFVGFVAVADELRPQAKAAIARAIAAGISVRMITGDHFETAYHIGRQLGLVNSREQVFDCSRLDKLSKKQLASVIETTRVYSRVTPEAKHMLLNTLKKDHVTAMTGDGVNDVPALTNAHIGLAMGSGTQIAKDAGDIILLNDNFKSIVDAVHEGRTIFANIKRMVAYLLSTNLGEILVSIGALMFGMPLPITPVQILWINLVTDTCMVIPLGLEPSDKKSMRRPPYAPNTPLLSRFMVSRIFVVAITMAVVTLTTYTVYLGSSSHGYAQSIAFTVLVAMQWASAICFRSDYESAFRRVFRRSIPFAIGLAAAIALQLLAIHSPLETLLHSTELSWRDIGISGLIGFIPIIIVIELHKLIGRLYFGKGPHAKTSRQN